MKQHFDFFRGSKSASRLLSALLCFSGCSVLNSFDDVVSEVPGEGGDRGDGDGDMGGAASGGTPGDGDGDGDTGGTGGSDGTGGEPPMDADPGLVIAMELGDELDNDVLYAISPQDGSELQTDVADYKTAAYEPRRDVWFFVRNNQIVAGRFDRTTNEWTFLSETGPEVLAVTDWTEQIFALNERLALKVGTKLNVYDTSDLTDITLAGDADYPVGTLWGAAANRRTIGGRVAILTKNCPSAAAATCPVELTSVTIEPGLISAGTAEVVDPVFGNALAASATGNVRYDIGSETLVVIVPNPDTVGGEVGKIADAYAYTPDSLNLVDSFTFQQPGNQIGAVDVDPCQSVAYTMSPQSENVSAFPMTDEAPQIPLFEPVGLRGRRIVYEPFTRSLMLIEDEAGDFGLEAYRIDGTSLEPGIRRRIADWSPPIVRPRFVAVATTDAPLCN